ncbi:hypothetical protein [Pinibacter soli]|uniref:Uncharacterized protein n=1 Tax=Pinibacter soli TaxID=3044211 RepID=A0ABT6RBQ6_9BACT|nr:hypothetical protein [Pinibacter soli]MDI3320006.1 hypothetical protein [Pinibacter soli]
MRKILITILLCIGTVAMYAQYNGMDSVMIGSSNIKTLIYPRAANRVPGKKYAVMIHYNSDSTIGADLSLMFKTGFPRQVANGKVQGTIADSIIHVCPQAYTAGALKTPDMFNQVMDYIAASLPWDSTKWTNGMYKYICLTGIAQGANDAWDAIAWYGTGNGELKYTLKISHAVFSSLPNIYPASQAFDNYMGTTTKFFHEQNTNSCCTYGPAQSISTTLSGQGGGTISTFTLMSFAGNGYNNLVWDSVFSPVAIDTIKNIYRWLLQMPGAPTGPVSQKIKVYESSVYDLSGRINHKDRPFNYFDGFETVDPANGDNTFNAQWLYDEKGKLRLIKGDTTSAIPGSGRDQAYFNGDPSYTPAFAGYYFPGKRGRCIVIDLNNDPYIKDALRTQGKKWKITDIYGYENNFEPNDTLYFYNFDKVIEETDVRKIPYMISRPDSTMTPFAYLVTTGGTASTPAWRFVDGLADSMRYIMIRNTLQQRSGYISTAYHNELVFYGIPPYTKDTAKAWGSYTGPLPKQTTIYDKLGVNTGVQIDTNTIGFLKNIRQYVNVDWYDTDTAAATKYKQLFNADYFPGYLLWNQYWRNKHLNHWLAVFGASKRAGKEAGFSVRNNIDTVFSEPGDWLHYKSHGRLFYQLAYKWGNNQSLNGSKYRWFNDTTISGYSQNWHNYLELGNEDDTYEPPAVSAAKLIMAVNGNMNRLGDTLGIRNADPGTKIIYAGQTYPDTSRIRTVMLLAYAMMKDTTTRLFDVFSYHDYSRSLDTASNVVGPTYEEQIGNGGMVPERNHWFQECDQIAKYIYRITRDTTIQTWNTEYGWDNNPFRSTTTADLAATFTTTGVPMIAGYDSVQSKAIAMMRIDLIMCATALMGCTEFNAHNGNLDQTNNVPVNFYTTGYGGGTYALSTKFPNYYSKRWMVQRMGNYYIDQVMSKDSTGLWVMKWRNKNATDSVMYSIWKGTETGATTPATFSVTPVISNSYQKEVYNFSTQASTITTVSATGLTVNITAGEMPIFLFAKEAGQSADPIINFRRGRFRIQ